MIANSLLLSIASPIKADTTLAVDSSPSNQPQKLYFTAHIGSADTDVDEAELQNDFARHGITANIDSIDGSRMGGGIGIGYQISTHWAAELDYLDLQEVEVGFNSPNTTINLSEVHPESGKGFTLSGIYQQPLTEHFSIRGRAGVFAWSADYDTVRNGAAVDNASKSNSDAYWGLGGAYDLSNRWNINLEFQRFKFERQNSDYVRIGVAWRLR